jgi:hypothetical protein
MSAARRRMKKAALRAAFSDRNFISRKLPAPITPPGREQTHCAQAKQDQARRFGHFGRRRRQSHDWSILSPSNSIWSLKSTIYLLVQNFRFVSNLSA